MKAKYKALSKVRFARLRRLRELNADEWIIKLEQVAMAVNRQGLRYTMEGSTNQLTHDLKVRHVIPLMGVGA